MKRSALLLLALVACGDDTSNPVNTPAPQPDGGTDTPPPPAPVTKSVTVAVAERSVAGASLAHAKVLFDKPGGDRVTVETDDNGSATITEIDWSKGRAALTLVADGFVTESYLELDEANASQTKFRIARKPAEVVAIDGTLTNATGNYVTLSAFGSGSFWQAEATSPYSLPIAKSKATTLVLLDWTNPLSNPTTVSERGTEQTLNGWYLVDQPALDVSGTHALDISTLTKSAVTKVTGHIALPAKATEWFGAKSSGYVEVETLTPESTDSSSNAFVGVVSRIDIDTAGTAFDYTLESIAPAGQTIRTRFTIATEGNKSFSYVFLPGTPADGYTATDFMQSTTVTTTALTYSKPIDLDGDVAAQNVLSLVAKGKDAWVVNVPAGRQTITLPKFDDALKTAIGGTPTAFMLRGYKSFDATTQRFTRSTQSGPYTIKP